MGWDCLYYNRDNGNRGLPLVYIKPNNGNNGNAILWLLSSPFFQHTLFLSILLGYRTQLLETPHFDRQFPWVGQFDLLSQSALLPTVSYQTFQTGSRYCLVRYDLNYFISSWSRHLEIIASRRMLKQRK